MKVTQCQRIIAYIKEFGSISTLEAFRDLGVARLASRIHDLKVIKDFEPLWNEEKGIRQDFIQYWGYDFQAAIYQAVEGEKLPFYICAVTKEAEPDLAVIQIPQTWIDSAMAIIKNEIGLIDAYKRGEIDAPRCEKCAYCRQTKKLSRVISADEFLVS